MQCWSAELAPARPILPSPLPEAACAAARFYNVVDLVNRLETETRNGRQGRLAEHLTRMDFIILDELGYLPFAQSGGQLAARSRLTHASIHTQSEGASRRRDTVWLLTDEL